MRMHTAILTLMITTMIILMTIGSNMPTRTTIISTIIAIHRQLSRFVSCWR